MIYRLYRNAVWSFANQRAHIRRKIRFSRGERYLHAGSEKLSVVLLSYKRPKNLNKILSCLRQCDFISDILISNNNPDVRLETNLDCRDSRVKLINQSERQFPSIRLDLSRSLQSEYVIAIDDDVFLEPWQLLKLFQALLENPSVVHGFAGHVYSADLARLHALFGQEKPVDALIMLFAYTKAHVESYFRILDQLQIVNRELRGSEDVPLSFAGDSYARIHDLGYVCLCPSTDRKGVATWTTEGFMDHRRLLVGKLRELRRFDAGGMEWDDVAQT